METDRKKGTIGLTRVQGCLLGCLGTVLILILLAVSAYYWAVTPGSQVPTDSILGADSLGLMHVEGLREDPGLMAMTQMLLTEMQSLRVRQAGRSEMPWFFQFLMTRQQNISDRDVQKALRDLPRDLTVTLESIPGRDEPEVAVAANLNRFPRLVRLGVYILSFQLESEDFMGYRLVVFRDGGPSAVTFVDQTLLWGQTAEVVRQVLQRREHALEGSTSGILEAYNTRDGRWDLYGVVENRENALSWILSRIYGLRLKREAVDRAAIQENLSGVEMVRFGIDVVDANALEAHLEVSCLSEEDATRIQEWMGEAEGLFGSSQWSKLQVAHRTRLAGKTLELTIQVSNIHEEIVSRIEKDE